MRKIIFLTIPLFLSLFCHAQDSSPANVNSISPPSPTSNNSTELLNGSTVNIYTGQVSVNVKIRDFIMSKMTIPIGIAYASSGIKVQELNSVIGVGWKLNAGGCISRYVQSLPDEAPNGYCGSNNIGSKTYSTLDTTYFNHIISEAWDSEPDRFNFSFLNYSGVFELDQNGNPVLMSSYGLKIAYCPFNRTTGRGAGGAEDWIIKDMAGNSYYFGDGATETSSVTNHGKGSNKSKSFISSWYISKIVTADNQTINFQYKTVSQILFTNFVNGYAPAFTITGQCSSNSHSSYAWNENTDVTIAAPLVISKITSSIFEIDFTSDNSPALLGINVLQNGKLEYSYYFDYTNFFSSEGYEPRLFLTDIRQVSASNPNAVNYLYGFTYNSAVNLPPRNSIKTDFWGYYNSNPGSSNIQGYLGGDKSFDPTKAAANILTTITNQYGGYTKFTYEQNDWNGNTTNTTTRTGGLRVKTVSNFSSVGDLIGKKDYRYVDPSTGYSSGQLYGNANNYSLPVALLYLVPPSGACTITDTYYYSEALASLYDLNGVQVGYSWVTVQNADGSAVRYHLTNFSDYPDINNEQSFYSGTQHADATSLTPQFPLTSYAFARGKVLTQQNLDVNNNVVSSTTNTYSLTAPVVSVITMKAYVQRYANGLPLYYLNGKGIFQTQDLLLASRTETSNFYNGGTPAGSATHSETDTYTSYGGNSFISTAMRTLSSGNTEKAYYRYPFDVVTTVPSTAVTNTQPLTFMVQNNIIAVPVETVTTVIKGGVETVVSASLSRFAAANGTVKQSSTYRLKVSGTLLKSGYQNYSVTPGASTETTTTDPNFEPVQFFTGYDGKGNLSTSNNPYTADGQTSSIWGYDQNYMVVQAKNARPAELLYEGFEEQPGWSSPVVYDNTFKHSGQYAGRIDNPNTTQLTAVSNSWLSVGLTGGRVYKYSAWVYSAKPSVDLYLYMKKMGETGNYTYVDFVTTTTINKWVYLEKEFALPADVVSLSIRIDNNGAASGGGSVWFDDIRLHPSDALMTTYSYEPLVGLTASEDAKGQTASYEYDGFKRLITERDVNNYIVKSYDYNKKLYKNGTSSQSFSRQNCGLGYTTTPVTYTVPYGQFTSTLSQADADAKAQYDILQNGQTYANNNGVCTATPTYVNFTLSNTTNISGYQARFSGPYTLTFNFPTNGQQTVQVPIGSSYTIAISPVGGFTINHTFQLTGYPTQTGPGVSFSNITVSASGMTLSIY